MAFDFPASPTPGQEFNPAGGPTYVWQPPRWVLKGVGVAWGGITGSLPAQTDLQAALNAKASLAGAAFTGDITVPDEAYGVAWNSSVEAPTKNALYDKIQSLPVVPALTTGGVTFGSATGTLGQDTANLFFDDTSNQLTVGGAITSPSFNLASSAAYFSGTAAVTTVNFDAFDFMQYAKGTDTLVFNVAAAERMRITSGGRVGIGYVPSSVDATFETGSAGAGGGMIRANIGGAGGSPTDPGLIIRNLSQANNTTKLCQLLAQGRTVAGTEVDKVGGLSWQPLDANWNGSAAILDIRSGSGDWRALTVNINGAIITGGLQYSGVTIQNKYASASQVGVAFNDYTNELGTPVGYSFCQMNTDGSAGLIFGATGAGARNVDRRAAVLYISTGQVDIIPSTVWINNGNLLLQHDGVQGYIRANNVAAGSGLYLGCNADNRVAILTTHMSPVYDNAMLLGTTTNRWAGIYVVSAPVVGSDERLKTWRGGLTPEEIAAGTEIADTIGLYQLNASIEEKGEDARFHSGVIAQTVGAILANHGLTPEKYGFFCYDEWEESTTPGTEGSPDVVTPAGNRYSIRYEELAMFLVAAQHQRMNAIEARMAAAGI